MLCLLAMQIPFWSQKYSASLSLFFSLTLSLTRQPLIADGTAELSSLHGRRSTDEQRRVLRILPQLQQ